MLLDPGRGLNQCQVIWRHLLKEDHCWDAIVAAATAAGRGRRGGALADECFEVGQGGNHALFAERDQTVDVPC